MKRALNYAHHAASPWSAAAGNGQRPRGAPAGLTPARTTVRPEHYPGDRQRHLLDLPNEGPHVIGCLGLGPSATKADYSNYGTDHIGSPPPAVGSATGTAADLPTCGNMILSSYPLKVHHEEGPADAKGNIVPGYDYSVVKELLSRVPAGSTPTCRAPRWRHRTRRGGGADRQPVRRPGPAAGRSDPGAGPGGAAPVPHRRSARLPGRPGCRATSMRGGRPSSTPTAPVTSASTASTGTASRRVRGGDHAVAAQTTRLRR